MPQPGSSSATSQPSPFSGPTANPADIDWPTWGFVAARSGENTSETIISPATVSGLHLLWSHKIGDSSTLYADTQPIVASNVAMNGANADIVFAGDEHGYFVALNAINGAVIWTKHLGSQSTGCTQLPDGVFGITDTPVLDRTRSRVYVVDGTGILWAFDLATGNVASGWPAGGLLVVNFSTLDHVWSGLSFDTTQNLLYVTTASYCDQGPWNGALRAVNVASASVTGVFYFGTGTSTKPQEGVTEYGGGVWGWGGVSIDPATHDMYGASGNLEPTEAAPYSDSVVEWSPPVTPIASSEPAFTASDNDFGGSTVLYNDAGSMCVAALRKDGSFFIYDRTNVANGPTLALSLSSFPSINTPAHSSVTHDLYVTNPNNGAYNQGLYAFTTQAGCTLNTTAVWSASLAPFVAPPSIADGVVFQPAGSKIYAFNAATGGQLWTSGSSIAGNIQNAASIVNGRVYVVDWNDTIYAFGM